MGDFLMKWALHSDQKPQTVRSQDWLDWRWQARNSPKTEEEFAQYFHLSAEEHQAFASGKKVFRFQTTPYYASLAKAEDLNDPIRKMIVPHSKETLHGRQQQKDPLGEVKHSPVPRVIHRYPDRVLFLVTDMCGVYCRYCTRKRFTGKDQVFPKSEEYSQALNYIRSNRGIREVILSGGDPLTLSDDRLLKVFEDLSAISHIELIRIGTRMPVVNPMRITADLVQMLKFFHPVYMMVHFNHPKEITKLSAQALTRLVDNGFPVMNQMVLLNGINNHEAIVQALSRRLLSLRVQPYYMFQVDPSEGTDHFRTSVNNSRKIQKELWGRVSGLMMPNLSLDIPGGGGKVGIVPDFQVSETKESITYKGWDGITAEYINPPDEDILIPADIEDYMDEWSQIKNAHYGRPESRSIDHLRPEATLF